MGTLWSKKMSVSDAQQPTRGSKMPFRFTRGDQGRDTSWFRDVLFADIDWVSSPDWKEFAVVTLDVTVLGKHLGKRKMRLDNNRGRSTNNSAPHTHLSWDDELRRYLEKEDTTGCTVTVERTDSDEFVLTISQRRT